METVSKKGMSKKAPPPTAQERMIAEIVNNARSERGMSIQKLADRALDAKGEPMMHRSSLSRVFDGIRPLSMGELFALCDALGLDPVGVLADARARLRVRRE